MQVIADIEAEMIVAGSVVYDADCVPDVRGIVSVADFHDSRCRAVYSAALGLADSGRHTDAPAVLLELRAKGLAEELGVNPPAFLAELHDHAPTGVNAEFAAGRMRDAAIKRRAAAKCLELIGRLHDPTGPADEIVAEYARAFGDLADEGAAGETTTSIAEELVEAGIRIDQLGTRDGVKSTPSGFADVDDILGGGFRPGELVLVGGRPGGGKSVFVRQAATTAAKNGVPAVLFSLEMARSEVVQRLIADEANINLGRLRGDKPLSAAEVARFASLNLRDLPLRFERRRKLRVGEIATTVRRLHRKYGTRLVVIDYLQLTEADNRRANRYEQVGEVSRTLKLLAGDLDVVVLAAVQVGRAAADEGIALHHLRESGSLEQDGDIVLLLAEEKAANAGPPVDHRDFVLKIAKQRNGLINVEVPLRLVGKFSRFEPAGIPL